MIQIVGLLLFILLGLGLIAIFGWWLMDKATRAALTNRFQDAEFILEHHRAPAAWARPRGFFASIMQGSGLASLRDRIQRGGSTEKKEERAKTRVLKRLDELIAFFEPSPFFQDAESREVFIDNLSLERASWEKKSLEEIVAQDTPA